LVRGKSDEDATSRFQYKLSDDYRFLFSDLTIR